MPDNAIFGKHQMKPGESRLFSSEQFSLGARREKEGWVLLYPEYFTAGETEKPDFEQGEYFQTGKSNTLFIVPALPEKPLVFKGSKLHVSPGQKLTFFLKIPLTIQVYFSKIIPENLMKEFPTQRLSDTWFGEPYSGEPAFSIGSEFFMTVREAVPLPFESICPVTIHNNSPGVLEVERLIIRVENMALYQNKGNIITSLLLVEYRGKEVISSATYHYSKSFHGEQADQVTKPRSESTRNLLKINFHFIKNLYKQEL
jgi:hypothetical protein